jgi:hypothetical protein
MKRTVGRVTSLIAILTAALVAPACGPDVQTICEQTEDCRGGNEEDVEACVVAHDLEGDLASEIGCSSEYEDYFDCFETEAECQDSGPTGIPCMTEAECGGLTCSGGMCQGTKQYGIEGDACEAERNAYQECFDLD